MTGRKKSGRKKVADGGVAGGTREAVAHARTASSARERRRRTAELRALAHPLRLRLFELFAGQPRTTMQVAEILGEPPTRLYHHVNALEKSGLLRLRETRPNRGTIEKYFEAVQPSMPSANRELWSTSAAARQSARAAAATVFEQARQDLFAAMRDLATQKKATPMLVRKLLDLTPARAVAMRRQLLEFVKDLKGGCRDDASEGGSKAEDSASEIRGANKERWSLTLSFARSWPPRDARHRPPVDSRGTQVSRSQ